MTANGINDHGAAASDPTATPSSAALVLAASSLAAAIPATSVSTTPLPPTLSANNRLSAWLKISANGYAQVFSGKVELGQGILTALSQIAAEELGVACAQVRMIAAATNTSPNEAVTSGSMSIQHSGAALRHVCAQARAIYVAKVATIENVAPDAVRVDQGIFYVGDKRIGCYWEMANDALLDCSADPDVSVKPPNAYSIVGQSEMRADIADKVFGRHPFIHDMVLPGMVHGRMVRPPSPYAELIEWNTQDVASWDGIIAIVRDGSLAGVVAVTEALAERAAARLANAATWREAAALPDETALGEWMKTRDTADLHRDRGTPDSNRRIEKTVRATYSKPFVKHASIGPSCALAHAAGDTLHVWSHSQSIYNLRRDLGLALDVPESTIVVTHAQGSGCYGHNGADDVVFDAAWLARHCPNQPVRVQWSRTDELNWSPMGPAMIVELEADVDADGNVVNWRNELWSAGHGLRPGREPTPTLLGSWYLKKPFPRVDASDVPAAMGGGADRNADPLYSFNHTALICHRVLNIPIRTSSLRALGAYANVFAIESLMDELADAANVDPLDYRLRQLSDPRAIAVLNAVAEKSHWREPQSATDDGHGRGIGFAKYKNSGAYCAVVAEIDVGDRIRVKKLHIAVDVGLVVNPDGVRQQIEGGAIQAVSWTLLEAARFDRTRMLGDGWDDYPILRFPDVPEVEVTIVERPGEASLGAGETSLGPTVAAIANALFNALGLRVRDLPLIPERIMAAMNA
jgi:nicotinate dehydrogenase subunit B